MTERNPVRLPLCIWRGVCHSLQKAHCKGVTSLPCGRNVGFLLLRLHQQWPPSGQPFSAGRSVAVLPELEHGSFT